MTNIHVTLSAPLSSETEAALEAWLTKRYGQHTVVYHIDESILGGIVIFDGERVYDGSIKSMLKTLK